MIADYERELLTLPKGTLVRKKVKGKLYNYLQYRDGKKIVSSYVGNNANMVTELNGQVSRRKHIEAMLKMLRVEYAQANKLIGEWITWNYIMAAMS